MTVTHTAPAPPRPTELRAAAPALIALCLAMLVEMVDNSVLNVALPTIGRDLDAGPTDLQWIVSAYSLTFGGLLLVGGTLGDKFGRRRVLLWGLAGFGASSLLVLFVHSIPALIALRALMGAFAAMMAPGTMSLVFRLFDDERLRARAIGLIVSVAMLGFAVGPTLSGLAVEHWTWQALLFLNAPVALIAFLGVRAGVSVDDRSDRRPGGIDALGAALSVATIGLGLYTLTLVVEDGWLAVSTIGTALGAIAAGIGFVVHEGRASTPMLDLRLFSAATVRGSALLQTTVMITMVGVMFVSTQLFQYAWGWSPVAAGAGMIPMVVGMFVGAPLVDKITVREGHRRTVALGCGLVITALLVMVASLGHGYPWFAAGMLVMAVGVRMVMTTSAVALLGALPADHTSVGSAVNDTAQELGNSIGVAVVGTVTAAVMGATLPTGRWTAALADEFLHAQRISFLVLAGISALIAVIGVRTLTDSTDTEE